MFGKKTTDNEQEDLQKDTHKTMTVSSETVETLLNHRSIRKFTDQPISAQTLTTIFEAGRAVSTSSFLQACSIVRVTDKQLRLQFRQISNNLSEDEYTQAQFEGKTLGHDYIENCAEFLVFCIDAHRHQQLAPESQLDWTEVMLIGAVDVALMAQNIMAAAESLGLGGVYIGSLRNDIERAGQILQLPRHVLPIFGMCLGHPDMTSKRNQTQRPRLPLDILVSENTYQPASEAQLAAYNNTVADYYKERSQVDLNWSQQIHNTFAKAVRPHLLPYMQAQGFAKR